MAKKKATRKSMIPQKVKIVLTLTIKEGKNKIANLSKAKRDPSIKHSKGQQSRQSKTEMDWTKRERELMDVIRKVKLEINK